MNKVRNLIPITMNNIHELKPGDWIWDDKKVERARHAQCLDGSVIFEPCGFRIIHILRLDRSVYDNKLFMLSDIDRGSISYTWEYFEEGRFFMFEKEDL